MRGAVRNLNNCCVLTKTAPIANNQQLFQRPFRAMAPFFSTSARVAMVAAYVSTVAKRPAGAAPVPEDAEQKTHHVKKNGKIVGFRNPYPSAGNFANHFQTTGRIFGGRLLGTLKLPDVETNKIPVVEPHFLTSRTPADGNADKSETGDGDGGKLRATWLGHACYFVEFPSGLRVLFDPVLEDRCSPVSFLGPRRYTAPAITSPEQLPMVDAVVISHAHYDHLSYPTVQAIKRSHPDAQFFAPLGLAKWFRDCGVTKLTELDWWEDAEMTMELQDDDDEKGTKNTTWAAGKQQQAQAEDDTKKPPAAAAAAKMITARFSCLPAQHSASRTPRDKDTTLWSSWAVVSGGKSVYFGGDTGYRSVAAIPEGADEYSPEYESLPRCPQFEQIGRLRGPFDLGLLPIGAYSPRWLFSAHHANPFDAVDIFNDTRCRRAMAIHWGTWALTFEDVLEPPRLLKEALRKKGIPETGVFDTCAVGETREF